MDARLVAWGRAVKARRRSKLPPLWLFTDSARMPSLETAVATLPPGLCGVVFRHDDAAGRPALLRRIAKLCRARRLALTVAGATGLPAGAGRHLRQGRGPRRHARVPVTASAHDPADLVRARRAGADTVFLSPVFPTASHPGGRALGVWRWGLMARRVRMPLMALGGIAGCNARRLPRSVAGIGAIGALIGPG